MQMLHRLPEFCKTLLAHSKPRRFCWEVRRRRPSDNIIALMPRRLQVTLNLQEQDR